MSPAEDAPVARGETEAERLKRRWGVELREGTETAWREVGRWMGDGTMEAIREAVGGDLAHEREASQQALAKAVQRARGAYGELAARAGRLETLAQWWLEGDPDAPDAAKAAWSDTPEPPQTPAERRTGEKLLGIVRGQEATPEQVLRVCPCPFCGAGTPSYVARVAPGERHPEHWYECRACNARGPRVRMEFTGDPQMEALKLWRARAAAPALPVEGEAEEETPRELAEWLEMLRSLDHDGPFSISAAHPRLGRIAALLRALPPEGPNPRTPNAKQGAALAPGTDPDPRALPSEGPVPIPGGDHQWLVALLGEKHRADPATGGPDLSVLAARILAGLTERRGPNTREPGAPTVGTMDALGYVAQRDRAVGVASDLADTVLAAHALLTAAGVPEGSLAARVERLHEALREHSGARMAAERLLAQRGAEGERLEGNGVALIAAERRRQMEAKGYDARHDDSHADGQLAEIAARLALAAGGHVWGVSGGVAGETGNEDLFDEWGLVDKHRDPIRRLIIAGALLAAEIDRLSRIVPPEGGGGKDGRNDEQHERDRGAGRGR